MIKLIKKDFVLAVHPTAYIFMLLSSMLLIPNYPYLVIFFYTSLAIFFTCLSGRENSDIFYSLMLPVKKSDIVGSRITTAILLELAQMLLAAGFAALRALLNIPANQAGIDANIALFAEGLIMFGLFNIVFFTSYYRNVNRVGTSFVLGTVASFLFILVTEVLNFVMPFVRDRLDTPDPIYIGEKLIFLAVGVVIFAGLSFAAVKISKASFEKFDI